MPTFPALLGFTVVQTPLVPCEYVVTGGLDYDRVVCLTRGVPTDGCLRMLVVVLGRSLKQ